MVNIEDFANRLKIIINYYEISATLLAEKIDVQRSSISHILSGRNKPSLDFVLKILKAFPEVELYWLMNGIGEFPNKVTESNLFSPTSPVTPIKEDNNLDSIRKTVIPVNELDIERIVIFYKNGTFKNYTS